MGGRGREGSIGSGRVALGECRWRFANELRTKLPRVNAWIPYPLRLRYSLDDLAHCDNHHNVVQRAWDVAVGTKSKPKQQLTQTYESLASSFDSTVCNNLRACFTFCRVALITPSISAALPEKYLQSPSSGDPRRCGVRLSHFVRPCLARYSLLQSTYEPRKVYTVMKKLFGLHL